MKRPGDANFPRECTDGLVLIYEWDSEYARALQGNLTDGFSGRCKVQSQDASSALRALVHLPARVGRHATRHRQIKSQCAAQGRERQIKDLRAQFEDAPPEHADGRSQYDYLRRLAERSRGSIEASSSRANGVKAIGIVGSDVYDKLLILQALRSRFEDKIFFTTDLDARYLHADQNDWARNLVVASNFGLSLRPGCNSRPCHFGTAIKPRHTLPH